MEKFPTNSNPEPKKEAPKKHFRNLGVATLLSLSSLISTAQSKSPEDSLKKKPDKEVVTETSTEKFLKFFDSLKQKDPETITPEDMDLFLDGLYKNHMSIPNRDSFFVEEKKFLEIVYKNHSPYSMEKKKVPFLPPGFDLVFGHDKEDRIMLNRILTETGFDFNTIPKDDIEDMRKDGEYSITLKKDFGDKKIKLTMTDLGPSASVWVMLIDNKTGKNYEDFVLGKSDTQEKVDESSFLVEFNKIISGN